MQSSAPTRPVMDVAGPPKLSQQTSAASPKPAAPAATPQPVAPKTSLDAPTVKAAPTEKFTDTTATPKPNPNAAAQKPVQKPRHSGAPKPGAPVGVIVVTMLMMMALIGLAVVVYMAA